MLYGNKTIKSIKSEFQKNISEAKERYFAIVGDNGLLVTKYPLHATEGIFCLKNVKLAEFSSEFETKKFAYTTYVKKYFIQYRRVPKNLKNLSSEYLWLNEAKTLKKSAHWITDYKVERRKHYVESKCTNDFGRN